MRRSGHNAAALLCEHAATTEQATEHPMTTTTAAHRAASDPVQTILELFQARGSSEYGGEAVTQEEHALQAAACAMKDNADDALVAAALLHDIGHLLHDLPDDAPEEGVDDHHENSGAAFIDAHFGPEVCEPVRLHVAAKRYLTAVEPDYMAKLSEPSITSLMLQGGPMSEEEQATFRANPHWEAALRLRRYDEEAKIPGAQTPSVADFTDLLRRLVR
jgi:phosphonate degradation associated HDIG domain protein